MRNNTLSAGGRLHYLKTKVIESLDKHLVECESLHQKAGNKLIWVDSAAHFYEVIPFKKDKNYGVLGTPNLYATDIISNYALNKSIQQPLDYLFVFPEFIISENGFMVIDIENQDSLKLLHESHHLIFILGIEQVITQTIDAELFLLGKKNQLPEGLASNYIFLIKRDDKENYTDTILFLDRGQSTFLEKPSLREGLFCIECNACELQAKQKTTTADTPKIIDQLRIPFVEKQKPNYQNAYLTPLNGMYDNICPVQINLNELIRAQRIEAASVDEKSLGDKYAWKIWFKTVQNRKLLNQTATLKNFTLKQFFKTGWGTHRNFPEISSKSFNQWWREQRKEQI